MEKILLSLALLLSVSITTSAQSSSETIKNLREQAILSSNKFLTVKGIELKPGIKMDDVLKKLQSKGLVKTELFDIAKKEFGIFDFTGTFVGINDCNVKILPTTNNKEIVGVISINFPYAETFKQLKDVYDRLKSELSQKYYLFTSEERFFDEYVGKSTSDFFKRNAIEKDEAIFDTRFHVSDMPNSLYLGQIVLKISHIKVDYQTKCFVTIIYCTPDNIEEQLLSAEDDL